MARLRPIKPAAFEKFLTYSGCEFVRQKGSRLVFRRADLIRPIIVPIHSGDLPVFVVRNTLRQLNMSLDTYLEILSRL